MELHCTQTQELQIILVQMRTDTQHQRQIDAKF